MGTWTPAFTCSRCYGLKGSRLPSGHLLCLLSQVLAVVQREVNKRLLRGEMLFFLIHKEKKLMSKKISHTTKNLFNQLGLQIAHFSEKTFFLLNHAVSPPQHTTAERAGFSLEP